MRQSLSQKKKKTNTNKRQEGHYIMINGSIHQDDVNNHK